MRCIKLDGEWREFILSNIEDFEFFRETDDRKMNYHRFGINALYKSY